MHLTKTTTLMLGLVLISCNNNINDPIYIEQPSSSIANTSSSGSFLTSSSIELTSSSNVSTNSSSFIDYSSSSQISVISSAVYTSSSGILIISSSSSLFMSSSSTSLSSSSQVAPADFVPCVVDVSNVGATCSGSDPSSCDGADIAMNNAMWPDPYQCFVCAPGITLLKGTACNNQNKVLTWNANEEQCILNGQGYPLAQEHACASGRYATGISTGAYNDLVSDWYTMATVKGTANFQANAGANAYIVDLKLEDGTPIQAAVSMGHGVLSGKCGNTFLIKVNEKYVLLLQTDIRAWSLELSPGANTWLDPTNVGGTCIIPEVREIDSRFVLQQFGL